MIEKPCPKCGYEISEFITSLNSKGELACPGCGIMLKFPEALRIIKKAIKESKLGVFKRDRTGSGE
jgi:DNA-directed RNA polymerase subunit RPC12/RpoP